MRIPAALGLLLLLLPALRVTAVAAPGDPRAIQGTIEWAQGPPGAPFVVVRADDGRYYYADVSRLEEPRTALARGDRILVTGVEGASPHEITAVSLHAGPAPRVSLTPPAAAPPAQAPPAAVQGAPPPAATDEPASAPPGRPAPTPARRLTGHVRSISGNVVVLRTLDGRSVSVNLGAVGPGIDAVVRPGDELTVFGHPDERGGFVATGYVHVEAPGMALPRRGR